MMPSPQMLDVETTALPKPVVFTNRVIWAAMVFGQVITACVFGVMIANGSGGTTATNLPTSITFPVALALLVFGVVGTLASKWVSYRGVRDDASLRRRYGILMIVPMAMLEGASFFGLVILLVTRQVWPVVIVPALAVAVQVTLFPSRTVKAPQLLSNASTAAGD